LGDFFGNIPGRIKVTRRCFSETLNIPIKKIVVVWVNKKIPGKKKTWHFIELNF